MDPKKASHPRFHSKNKNCDIVPVLTSFKHGYDLDGKASRYSQHFCNTHQVTLGHWQQNGKSDQAWELHYFGGTFSLNYKQANKLLKHGKYVGMWAKYKKTREPSL